MITEVVGSPSDPDCNPRIRVVMHVGVENHAGGDKKDIPTTDASATAIRSFSSSVADECSRDCVAEPESTAGLKGFRKRWSSAKSVGSMASVDPIADFSPVESLDEIEQFTPSFVNPVEEHEDEPEPSGPVMPGESSARFVNHEFLSNVKWAAFKMPWELPGAKSVFSPESLPSIDLRQDPSWGSVATPLPVATESSEEAPRRESTDAPVFVNCIRAIMGKHIQGYERKTNDGRS